MDQPHLPAHPKARSTARLLEELLTCFPNERVSFGELIDQLDSRAHGVLLLVLALPMCIPNVPGISTIFGVLMLLPALSLTMGSRRLWAPERMRAWTFPRESLTRTLRAAIPTLRRLEVLIKPRLPELTRFPITILVGLQTLVLALVLVLPIPFGNWPPGMTVAMTALALLQRDGALMLLTLPAAIVSASFAYIFGRVSLGVVHQLIDGAQSLLSNLN
jgi:hypothetical protein